MKAAYVSLYDAKDVNNWSGLGYFISNALEKQKIYLDYVGPLQSRNSSTLKVKKKISKLLGYSISSGWEESILKKVGAEVDSKLKNLDVEFLFGPGPMPFVYSKTSKPIFTWTDSCFPGLVNFYNDRKLLKSSYSHAMKAQKLALQKSTLSIFSSDWAASIAIDKHNIKPEKVAVVPFGANIHKQHSKQEVTNFIDNRSDKICKLLFIGVEWFRKGGDIVLNAAKELANRNINVELTIVGCDPISSEPLPNFVKPLGFISKRTEEGQKIINRLLSESHFLFVPSRAEAYGLVFCEANAFGVPAISSNEGGITTIIKNDINGKAFQIDSKIDEYANYIEDLFYNSNKYKMLAHSAYEEYNSRLNWDVAGIAVKRLIEKAL